MNIKFLECHLRNKSCLVCLAILYAMRQLLIYRFNICRTTRSLVARHVIIDLLLNTADTELEI